MSISSTTALIATAFLNTAGPDFDTHTPALNQSDDLSTHIQLADIGEFSKRLNDAARILDGIRHLQDSFTRTPKPTGKSPVPSDIRRGNAHRSILNDGWITPSEINQRNSDVTRIGQSRIDGRHYFDLHLYKIGTICVSNKNGDTPYQEISRIAQPKPCQD